VTSKVAPAILNVTTNWNHAFCQRRKNKDMQTGKTVTTGK